MKIIIILLMIGSINCFSQTGYLNISSEPTGALIYIDGQYKGNTPVELISISSGSHTVSISFENYETENINVQIKYNEIEKRHIILKKSEGFKIKPGETGLIQQSKGKLTVITDPSGATVYIDGELVDEETPFTVEQLGAGVHNITIKSYISDIMDELVIQKEVRVETNKATLLKVNIDEYLGKLTIITEPSDATVQINDEVLLDKTPFTKRLTTGTKTITITNYIPDISDDIVVNKEIRIDGNKTAILKINFNEYFKKGILISESNRTDRNIIIENIDSEKGTEISFPSRINLLVGKYKVYEKVLGYNSEKVIIEFEIFPEKESKLYIPFKEEILPYKPVTNHKDYLTLDKYIKNNSSFLPETKEIVKTKFKFTWWIPSSVLFAGLTIFALTNDWQTINLDPNGPHNIPDKETKLQQTLLWGTLTLGSIIAAILVGQEEYSVTEPDPNNISTNNLTKSELKKSYEILYRKWQDEMYQENEMIKQKNEEIDKRNLLFPKASVNYY